MRALHLFPLLALLTVLAACGEATPPTPRAAPSPPPAASASAPTPAAPVTRQLTEDTTVTRPSGATFTAPKGWFVTESADVLILEDPERQLKATVVETPEADAMKAIEAAWQRVAPGFAFKPLHDPQSPPPVRGWESVTDVDYETKATDHRAVFAEARRYGGTTYVSLVDSDLGALSRRGPQLGVALGSFRPQGMHEESFAGKTPRPIGEAQAKELGAFIEAARIKLDVPGAAVAVVLGGKVAYEKGFGVRALGKKDPVTPSTLFMMGSITKSMTTLMEATLVDAGKLKWDTPVTELLPTFALGDAATTSRLVLWQTACACTGMPRRDMELLFEYAHTSPEERVASMKTMSPTTGFGETFQYSNLMVAAGGYAAAHAVDPKRRWNEAYDEVMHRTVFGPIGMKSTTFDFAVARRGDHAMPHARSIDGAEHEIPVSEEDFVTPLRPAGAAWSNLHDMERYVMTEIDRGVTPEGKRVVSEANLIERRRARVRAGEHESYALGLGVGTFRDLPYVAHTGGTLGFGTLMFILPEQGVAILSLTNTSDPAGFNDAVQRKVIEEIFEGAKPLADARVEFFAKAKHDDIAKTMERVSPPDAKWVHDLVGTYSNADLGKVTVSAGPRGGGTFDAGEWKSVIGQMRDVDGTLKVVLVDPPIAGLELLIGGDDQHRTLTLLDDQVKYVFERSGK